MDALTVMGWDEEERMKITEAAKMLGVAPGTLGLMLMRFKPIPTFELVDLIDDDEEE